MIDGFETVFYTLSFIVPGFILYITFSSVVPSKGEDFQLTTIRFLFFSCINYAIWSWLIYLINTNKYLKDNDIVNSILWFVIIFISPIVLGLIAGHCSDKGIVRKFLQGLGFNPVHTIPTSWDYKFSKLKNTTWVIVTLDDGNTVSGKFSTNSFVSSDADERDIYIESIYKITEDGDWVPVDRSDGILIKGSSIKYVEFLSDEIRSEENGKQKTIE